MDISGRICEQTDVKLTDEYSYLWLDTWYTSRNIDQCSVIMRADKNLMLDIFGHLCLHISAKVFLEDPDEDDLKLVWFGDTRKEK